MTQPIPPLVQRVMDLEARIERLEAALRGEAAPVEPAPVRVPVALPATPTPTPPRVPAPTLRAAAVDAPGAPALVATPPVAAPPRDPANIERLVGGRWFAAIGAVVIVIGLALSLKLAWDAGYLRMPPIGRVLAVAGFGAVLLLAGEVVLRRFGKAASTGLFGAGVGAIFVAAYGSHALYGLVGPMPAFALMAASAGLGVLVAVRADLVSIGLLSLVGAYLTPFLAPAPEASVLALPIYLLGLTGAGVALAWWRRRFVAVKALAWSATVLVGTAWMLRDAAEAPWVAMAFIAAVWAGFHLDRARAARPRGAEPESPTDEPPVVRLTPGESGALLGGLLVTAWAAVMGWGLIEGQIDAPGWMAPAALAAASLMGSVVLAGLLSPLRERPRTPAERLGVTLLAQSGALLFAAVALALSGWVETLTWAGMGLAAAAAAWWVRSRAMDVYALVLLGFATGRAVLFESTVGGLHDSGDAFLGLMLTAWTALLACTAVALLIAARLLAREPGAWRTLARLIAAGACGLFFIGLIHPEAAPRSVVWAWLGVSLLVSLGGRAERVLLLHRVAPLGALTALGAWSVAELMPGWSEATAAPGLHPGLWEALAIAGVGIVLGRLAAWPGGKEWEAARAAPVVGAVALVFGATSLEVARSAEVLLTDPTVRAGAVSIWWGLFAVGLLIAGVARRVALVRWAGLGLMLAAVGKAVIVDLADTSPAVRVASFLGLGVLMVVVAAGYLRVSRGRQAGRLRGGAGGEDDAPAQEVSGHG